MIDSTLMAAILDSLKDPLLFSDTQHTIRYMNKAALAYYSEGEKLLGRSLLECHNETSRQIIIETLADEAGAVPAAAFYGHRLTQAGAAGLGANYSPDWDTCQTTQTAG